MPLIAAKLNKIFSGVFYHLAALTETDNHFFVKQFRLITLEKSDCFFTFSTNYQKAVSNYQTNSIIFLYLKNFHILKLTRGSTVFISLFDVCSLFAGESCASFQSGVSPCFPAMSCIQPLNSKIQFILSRLLIL